MSTGLGADQLGPTARGLVSVIERNAAREMRLVDDVLTMAFLDGDRLRIGREPMDHAADDGVGLRQDETTKIFERLYRTPSAVAAHTQGAGLGRSIVRKIVEAHGGTAEVESEPGAARPSGSRSRRPS